VFVKVAIPIFFFSLFLFHARDFFLFLPFFCFSNSRSALTLLFAKHLSPYGWVLDDFLATRADRRLVVRFRRHRSGATGVRATD